jgi:hypothetical protein
MFGEGSDHFGSYLRNFFMYFFKMLFSVLIDSLTIGWIVGAMIYFTGKVSSSSPG